MASDGILAEIVHLPSSRVGNILSRPHLRDYEIIYLAGSDLTEDRKIPISDLMLSYRNGELILRSKKLNKRVFPRLTTAHNFYNDTLPMYRFLCDLQYDGTWTGTKFEWGSLTNALDYLPRVRYNRSILSLASWKVRTEEMDACKNLTGQNFINEIKTWREKRKIPQHVILANGDNELFVDMESEISVRALLSVVQRQNIFVLKEFIFELTNAWNVAGNNDIYLNECIVPFFRNQATS